MKDELMDKIEFATKELESIEPKEKIDNMETIQLNAQQIEFIIENFKAQLNMVEEEKLSLSGTSQMIMEQIISKLEDDNG